MTDKIRLREKMRLARLEKNTAELRARAAMYSFAAALTPYIVEILFTKRKKGRKGAKP